MSCLILMLDNNKLFETILCINDEEHGEIISIKLQFISKPVLTANGNIDYKNITHNYTNPGYFLCKKCNTFDYSYWASFHQIGD